MVNNKSQHINFTILPNISVFLLLIMSFMITSNYSELTIAESTDSNETNSETNKNLSVSIGVEKNPITAGSDQSLKFSVIDADTMKPVSGAAIVGYTVYGTPHRVNFDLLTDSLGMASFRWKIPSASQPGMFEIIVHVGAMGYRSTNNMTVFEVINN